MAEKNGTGGGSDRWQSLIEMAIKFRDERDWKQFHTPNQLAACLMLEAAEVLELMQWKEGEALASHLSAKKAELADELADVLHAVILLAEDHQIDLPAHFADKMRRNAEKYPVEKSRGKSTKYTDL
jgi:dCTP diphosphatase